MTRGQHGLSAIAPIGGEGGFNTVRRGLKRKAMACLAVAGLAACVALGAPTLAQRTERGIKIEDHAWPVVEAHLRPDSVVVIPLGAAAKEHGPHLKLRNDLTMAEYLTRRVVDADAVTVAPPLTYHYYPAFLEYPGSTSLGLETARDLTADAVRSLARYGPRRFYVLNTGISTNRPLQLASTMLAREGIVMRYTDFGAATEIAARAMRHQPAGSHADEIETSLMLHIAPDSVDMKRAVKDLGEAVVPFRLTRSREGKGTYSASGVWGDPTLATAAKGAVIAEGLVRAILDDIARLRGETPPNPSSAPDPPAAPRPPSTAQSGLRPGDCSGSDLRAIREVGDSLTYRWSVHDAYELALQWTPFGDVIHPDGLIERTAEVIKLNRQELFSRREYRNSKHPVTITMTRCPTPDMAIADGRWSLNSVVDASGRELPPYDGQVSMVLRRIDGSWKIEAYRYTMKAPTAAMPPVWLKRPGWPGKE